MSYELTLDLEAAAVHAEQWQAEAGEDPCSDMWFSVYSGFA